MAGPDSQFPAGFDKSGETLFTAPNANSKFIPAGRLSIAISPTDTTLRVVGIDLNLVPDMGLVTVGDELVRYTSKNADLDELYVANEELRGYSDSEAVAHNVGTQVMWMLTNEHLKSIHASIESVQKTIGVQGSEDPDSVMYKLETLQAQVANGDLKQAAILITEQHVSDKSLQLPEAVKNPASVIVFVVNGGSQENGIDYTVSGTAPAVLMWAGLSLDGLLAPGDKLLVLYEQALT